MDNQHEFLLAGNTAFRLPRYFLELKTSCKGSAITMAKQVRPTLRKPGVLEGRKCHFDDLDGACDELIKARSMMLHKQAEYTRANLNLVIDSAMSCKWGGDHIRGLFESQKLCSNFR